MSVATITTFGFGSYGTVNNAIVLGFLSGNVPPPPPVVDTNVPGPADKSKRRDRKLFLQRIIKKRRKLQALKQEVPEELNQLIEQEAEIIANIEVAPSLRQWPDLIEQKLLFKSILYKIPKSVQIIEEDDDDEAMFLMSE